MAKHLVSVVVATLGFGGFRRALRMIHIHTLFSCSVGTIAYTFRIFALMIETGLAERQ
jgi:hypothetical protein